MQWTQKLVSDLPDLRAPITVNVDTTCSEAVTMMKNYCIDQLPVVQQFPNMGPEDKQVIAVISMAALSREMLKHPEIVDSPLFPYASPKFVVVQPSATLGELAGALPHLARDELGALPALRAEQAHERRRALRRQQPRLQRPSLPTREIDFLFFFPLVSLIFII